MTLLRRRVLLVDDVEGFRRLIRIAIEEDGRLEVVAEAADGGEGVSEARRTQPELVMLDLAMPHMDGFDAIPAIRSVAPHARILVVSGRYDRSMEPVARELGASGFVRKDATPEEIVDALAELAAG